MSNFSKILSRLLETENKGNKYVVKTSTTGEIISGGTIYADSDDNARKQLLKKWSVTSLRDCRMYDINNKVVWPKPRVHKD